MLVLIVEDEPLIAVSLELELELAGHQVLGPADDPEHALRLAAEHRPDVALVDIGLHGSTRGVELARSLRLQYDVAVLFVTMTREVALENKDAALGVINKPFDPDDVPESVEIARAVKLGKYPAPNALPSSLELFPASAQKRMPDRRRFDFGSIDDARAGSVATPSSP
ncbi:MAG TPA: response regulator [Steroidobacteraceae bacterium]|jgi:DNA-binding response OmpR family regulator|nr:response regulator [Steroidobacteraceae bacterium]